MVDLEGCSAKGKLGRIYIKGPSVRFEAQIRGQDLKIAIVLGYHHHRIGNIHDASLASYGKKADYG